MALAAIDGTGFESRHASSYYVKRRANTGKYWQRTTYQRFPKAGIVCDCHSHLILAVVPGRGPGPDITHFRPALDQALSRVQLAAVAADAGYDAEHAHRFAHDERGVRLLMPAKIGRQTTKPATGYWRRQMQRRLHLTRYSQRWQVETVNSMLKRLLGSALRPRSYWSQCREILLRAITLNIMILRRPQGFYRASHLWIHRTLRGAIKCPGAENERWSKARGQCEIRYERLTWIEESRGPIGVEFVAGRGSRENNR